MALDGEDLVIIRQENLVVESQTGKVSADIDDLNCMVLVYVLHK